jgi:nitroimidazol reductase NimA-like FMN-containing flavoprotein (pyridoxamine 5'-phosphate oxidase superfamily)
MASEASIRRRIGDLFTQQRLAVLATQNQGEPYANLVAFWASTDLRHLYFITPRSTRKFANLSADGRVSLLITDSLNRESDFHDALAVTAVGAAAEVTGPDKDRVLVSYLAKHPYLEDFARAPTCALIKVNTRTYILVSRFQNVMELHITS